MASLGRLTIDMVANLAGFERDMGKADRVTRTAMRKVSRELNRAERDAQQAAGSIKRLGLQLGALSAVGVAVVTRELQKMSVVADRLDKTSGVVGVTVEALQELRFAAQQAAGLGADTLDMALQRFSRRVGEAANGTGELLPIVKELGISLRDSSGNIRDQTDLLGEFANAVKNAGSEQEQLRIAFKLFDSEGARLVNLLREGSDGIEEFREQFRQTGATMTGDVVADFVRFNDELNVLRQRASAVGVSIGSDLITPLADFAQFLNTEQGIQVLTDALDSLRRAAIVVGGIIAGRFVIQLTAATVQLAIASAQVVKLTVAKMGLAGASRTATVGVVGLRTAISTLLGPVGIALGALSAFAFTMRDSVAAALDYEDAIHDLRLEMRSFRNEQEAFETFDRFAQQAEEAQEEVERLQTRLERLRRNIASGNLPPGASQNAIQKELENATGALEEAQREFEDFSERASEAYDAYVNFGKGADDASEDVETVTRRTVDAGKETDAYRKKLEDLADQLDGGNAAALRQFNRRMVEAADLLMRGEITLADFAQAAQLAQRALNGELTPATRTWLQVLEEANEQLGSGRAQIEAYANALESLSRTGLMAAGSAAGFDFGDLGNANNLEETLERTFRDAAVDGITEGVTLAFSRLDAQDVLNMSMEDLGRVIGQSITESLGNQLGGQVGELLGKRIGEKVGGSLGQSIGASLPGIAGVIGSILGSVIGDKLFGEKDPILQVAGASGFSRDPAEATRRGDTVSTALGDIFFRFRKIDEQAQGQLKRALREFDATLASIVGSENLDEAMAALDGFKTLSMDPAEILAQRFDSVLSVFDEFTQNFVREGESLEAQMQRLADVSLIRARQNIGDTMGAEDGNMVIWLAGQLARAGETVAASFQRLLTVTGSLDTAMGLTGNALAGGRDQVIRFSDALLKAFGDDMNRLTGGLSTIFEAFFSDEEVINQAIAEARSRAADLFGALGVGVSEELFTEGGFRELFDDLFGSLDADATAQLIEAGVAVADLIALEEELAGLRGDVAEETETAADNEQALLDAMRQRNEVMQGIEETIALTPLNDFQQSLVGIQRNLLQNIAALQQSASVTGDQAQLERDLARAHEAAAVSAARAIAQLESATRQLVDDVFGTPLDAINEQIRELESQGNGAAKSLSNVGGELAKLIEFADGLLIGNLSPLGSRRRLEEGLAQLRAASDAGDSQRVQSLAQQVLQIGRERFASGGQFGDLFSEVQGIIRSTRPAEKETQPVSVVSSPALNALFAERDRLEAEEAERNRRALSLDIAQNVADIAGATGDSFEEVAERLGFNLEELGEILGLDLRELNQFLREQQADTDTIASSLEGVGTDIVATLDTNHQESVTVLRDNVQSTRDVEGAVRELITAIRDQSSGAGRSLRTRESIRP